MLELFGFIRSRPEPKVRYTIQSSSSHTYLRRFEPIGFGGSESSIPSITQQVLSTFNDYGLVVLDCAFVMIEDAAAAGGAPGRPRCDPRAVCSVPLVMFVSGKLWTYGGLRFLYPMSEFLAKDWGLSSTQMSAVLAMGEFVPAGLFSSAGDVIGPYRLAVSSFLLTVIASFGMLLPPSFPSLLVFRFMFGFGLFLFMVGAQTAATNEAPPAMRDCVTGTLEITFSLSGLILVPILSVVYQNGGWRAPFGVLAAMITLHLPYLVYMTFFKRKGSVVDVEADENNHQKDEEEPRGIGDIDEPKEGTTKSAGNEPSGVGEDSPSEPLPEEKGQREGLRVGLRWNTGALAFNLSGFCLTIAINLLVTELGLLLHSYFGLSEAETGTASLAMSLAEFSGTLVTIIYPSSGFMAMEITGVLMFGAMLLYSYIGTLTLPISLGGLVFVAILGEFGTVQRFSRAPLFASPEDASAMLGMHVQFQVLGRTIGAAIAAQLFFRADDNFMLGHAVCCWVSAACALLMVVFCRIAIVLHRRHDVAAQAYVNV